MLALVALLGGCSAPVRPELPAAAPTSASVRVPSDGATLRDLGVSNGPVTAFSLPRTVLISTSVDQPNGVTLVLSRPSPDAVAGYLRRALPQAGFEVTGDNQATATLTFTGYGWHGSFTGTGDSSAVILRP